MRIPKPAKLSIEDASALVLAAVVTAVCVRSGWFDHVCMTLRRGEQYQLDEFVGGSVVFLVAAVFMFVRREWQLRACLEKSAAREQTAHDAARHDYLTGLANRLALMERLDEVREQDLAFLLIDLDGFKAVNDHHGHAAGDEVLKEVSRRLLEISSRTGGLVARLGGDEFGYLLPTASEQELALVRDGIIRRLRQTIRLRSGAVAIGASVGSATSTNGRLGPDDLLQSADAAMYRTKLERRDETPLVRHAV